MANTLGIDAGTCVTRMYHKEKDAVILQAPSYVATDLRDTSSIWVGKIARDMVGKTPREISAFSPMEGGVIVNPTYEKRLLAEFFRGKQMDSVFTRPSCLVSVPHGITKVEKKAMQEAVLSAGARRVALVSQCFPAAVGGGISLRRERSVMLLNVGGGITECTVLSATRIIASKSLRKAGIALDDAIIDYLSEHLSFQVGRVTAEELKRKIATADATMERGELTVFGRDLLKNQPAVRTVSYEDIHYAIRPVLIEILQLVESTLKDTPPLVCADLLENGIYLYGGSALLPGLSTIVGRFTKLPVRVFPNPVTVVTRGLGIMLKNESAFSDFIRYVGD